MFKLFLAKVLTLNMWCDILNSVLFLIDMIILAIGIGGVVLIFALLEEWIKHKKKRGR